MLLKAEENGAGAKSDTPPDEWFKDKDPEYLVTHLIPPDPALWQIDRFEDFVTERKKLIKDKFGYCFPCRQSPQLPERKCVSSSQVVSFFGQQSIGVGPLSREKLMSGIEYVDTDTLRSNSRSGRN
jgi:hypothetical protein